MKNKPKPDDRSDNVDRIQENINMTIKNLELGEEMIANTSDEKMKENVKAKNDRRFEALDAMKHEIIIITSAEGLDKTSGIFQFPAYPLKASYDRVIFINLIGKTAEGGGKLKLCPEFLCGGLEGPFYLICFGNRFLMLLASHLTLKDALFRYYISGKPSLDGSDINCGFRINPALSDSCNCFRCYCYGMDPLFRAKPACAAFPIISAVKATRVGAL
jgi:small acid-soluble spore protein (thioredoxin-like protein)